MSTSEDSRRPLFEHRRRDRRHWRVLNELFAAEGFGAREVLSNFPAYVRRRDLPRFLAHYELFKLVRELPGCFVELGVFRGAGLFTWAKLVETFCASDRTRKVYGFDHFQGLKDATAADGGTGGEARTRWTAPAAHARVLVELHNDDGLVAGDERVKLIEGDVRATLPRFLADHPGLRIALLHADLDLFAPTKAALELLYPLVVPGGVVCFDQYGLVPWAGETQAADELLTGLGEQPRLRKFPFAATPGGYFVKG